MILLKKRRNIVLTILLIFAFIAGFGVGFGTGQVYFIKETFKALDYVDNINIAVDLNESELFKAAIPYFETEATP